MEAKVIGEELKYILRSFKKEKILGLDGYMVEFYLGFYEFSEKDLLRVIEESWRLGKILSATNATFIALIPKNNDPSTFDYFRPIPLCNLVQTIISKLISNRMKQALSMTIFEEQFGFLFNRKIHDVVGTTQEDFYSINVGKYSTLVMKTDLSKTYDKVSWVFLRLVLLQIVLNLQSVN